MTEAGQPLIQIQDLTKVFYTDEIETHALSGIHLSVNKGEYVAMSGPSGCGKSTLLSIIGLLDTPTAGRYSLNGKTVENLDFAERSRITKPGNWFYLSKLQSDWRFDGLRKRRTAADVPAKDAGGGSQGPGDGSFGTGRHGASHPALSVTAVGGGQQQRVAVARALGGKPSILLADEPTGNLDSRNGEAVMELLQNLHREGATICMVTHDPRFAKHAQREVHLFDGKVVAEEELKKLLQETSA